MPTLDIPDDELTETLQVLRAGLKATEGEIRSGTAIRLMGWCIRRTQEREVEDVVGRPLKWTWKSF